MSIITVIKNWHMPLLILTCMLQNALSAVQHANTAPAESTKAVDHSEKKEIALRIFNASPVTITVRYATSQIPALTETILANTAKTIERDPAHPIIYSFGDAHAVTFPITPDMIMQGEVTIHPFALNVPPK